MLPNNISNKAYDTEPYHVTISIYGFDVHNAPQRTQGTELLKGVNMDTAKRKAHQRAVASGFTVQSAWHEASGSYSTREYRTQEGARRLVVVERS